MSIQNTAEFQETMKMLNDKKFGMNIWEINEGLKDKNDDIYKVLQKIFNESQLDFISCLIDKIISGLDTFHNSNISDSHEDIRNELSELKDKFNNHRHDVTKIFSDKPTV